LFLADLDSVIVDQIFAKADAEASAEEELKVNLREIRFQEQKIDRAKKTIEEGEKNLIGLYKRKKECESRCTEAFLINSINDYILAIFPNANEQFRLRNDFAALFGHLCGQKDGLEFFCEVLDAGMSELYAKIK